MLCVTVPETLIARGRDPITNYTPSTPGRIANLALRPKMMGVAYNGWKDLPQGQLFVPETYVQEF